MHTDEAVRTRDHRAAGLCSTGLCMRHHAIVPGFIQTGFSWRTPYMAPTRTPCVHMWRSTTNATLASRFDARLAGPEPVSSREGPAGRVMLDIGDQPRVAAEPDIGPQPVDHDDYAVAEADEKENVGKPPQHPGQKPFDVKLAELNHGAVAPDGGKVAVMPVPERIWCPATQPGPDRVPDIVSRLLGGGRQPGYRPAVGVQGERRVADDEDLRM